MKEAFNFMFKDNMLKKKALIVLLFLFIANLLTNIASTIAPPKGAAPSLTYTILAILGMLFLFIPNGYGITCVKSFIEQKENIVLPFLNIKNNFILGLKQAIAILIAVLLLGIGITATTIVFSLIFGLVKLESLVAIIAPILVFLVIITFVYYSLGFSYIFATTENLTSFLQFKKANEMIKPVKKQYLLTLLLMVILSIVTGIISAVVMSLVGNIGIVGLVLSTLISSIVSIYFLYVYSFLVSRAL